MSKRASGGLLAKQDLDAADYPFTDRIDFVAASQGKNRLLRRAWGLLRIQDVIGLDSDHRMNTPGTAAGDWDWRLPPDASSEDLAGRLRRFTELAGRAPSATAGPEPTS